MRKLLPYLVVISLEFAVMILQQGCAESESSGCPADAGMRADDVSAAPRADKNLELLALDAQPFGRLSVDPAVYERVVRDVAAARGLEPELADVSFMPANDGQTFLLDPGRDNLRKFERGAYHGLDCFFATYGGEIVGAIDHRFTPDEDDELLVLRFHGTYHAAAMLNLLSDSVDHTLLAYGAMNPDGSPQAFVDGPTICLATNDVTWHYVFVDTDGPCTGETCQSTTDFYFTSDPNGEVVLRDTWVESNATPPVWMQQLRGGMCGRKRPFEVE